MTLYKQIKEMFCPQNMVNTKTGCTRNVVDGSGSPSSNPIQSRF